MSRRDGSPNRGTKGNPNPEREHAGKHRIGVDDVCASSKSRSAEQAPCHTTVLTISMRRFTMSAMAPAGSVNRKNGAEAAVAMRESENDEAPRSFINHVAVTSWAETNVPDITLASHKRQNAGFRSANQVAVDFLSIGCSTRLTIPRRQIVQSCLHVRLETPLRLARRCFCLL